jgi:hypothetical protein
MATAFTLTDGHFPLVTPHDALLEGRTYRRAIDGLPLQAARRQIIKLLKFFI